MTTPDTNAYADVIEEVALGEKTTAFRIDQGGSLHVFVRGLEDDDPAVYSAELPRRGIDPASREALLAYCRGLYEVRSLDDVPANGAVVALADARWIEDSLPVVVQTGQVIDNPRMIRTLLRIGTPLALPSPEDAADRAVLQAQQAVALRNVALIAKARRTGLLRSGG